MKKMDNIKERANSYESACKFLNEKESGFVGLSRDEIAYRKLKTIAKAIRADWVPNLDAGEWFYYPVFYFYTNAELAAMSEKEIKERGITRLGGSAIFGALAGWRSVLTAARFSTAYANYGFRLCVRNREEAEYFGKQFIELWGDYLLSSESSEDA